MDRDLSRRNLPGDRHYFSGEPAFLPRSGVLCGDSGIRVVPQQIGKLSALLNEIGFGESVHLFVEPRSQAAQPAVTVEAGAMWIDTYNAVTTKAGRYVQGGGCTTVGVAGLIQSGGFGSFSKKYGMAAAALLEAEVVTADGALRTANARTNPDLFWAIKGGGGGSLGVVTKLTLRTHELPAFFGGIIANITATSDAAFRRLIGQFISFYKDSLFNPDWGEIVAFRPDNTLAISMVFQGFDKQQAEKVWQPFFDWVRGSPVGLTIESAPTIVSLPARNFWNAEDLGKKAPGMVFTDDRPGAADTHMWWASNQGEVGHDPTGLFFVHHGVGSEEWSTDGFTRST